VEGCGGPAERLGIRGVVDAPVEVHRPEVAQTALIVVLIAPFAIFGVDPVLTLFSWFSGLSVASLLVV
jgi:hypothetical protein